MCGTGHEVARVRSESGKVDAPQESMKKTQAREQWDPHDFVAESMMNMSIPWSNKVY